AAVIGVVRVLLQPGERTRQLPVSIGIVRISLHNGVELAGGRFPPPLPRVEQPELVERQRMMRRQAHGFLKQRPGPGVGCWVLGAGYWVLVAGSRRPLRG